MFQEMMIGSSGGSNNGAYGTCTDTTGNSQTVTINTGLSSVSRFALRCEGNSAGTYHSTVFWTSDNSTKYQGYSVYGTGTSGINGAYNEKDINTLFVVWCPIVVSVSGGTVTLKTGSNANAAIKNAWWVAVE